MLQNVSYHWLCMALEFIHSTGQPARSTELTVSCFKCISDTNAWKVSAILHTLISIIKIYVHVTLDISRHLYS